MAKLQNPTEFPRMPFQINAKFDEALFGALRKDNLGVMIILKIRCKNLLLGWYKFKGCSVNAMPFSCGLTRTIIKNMT